MTNMIIKCANIFIIVSAMNLKASGLISSDCSFSAWAMWESVSPASSTPTSSRPSESSSSPASASRSSAPPCTPPYYWGVAQTRLVTNSLCRDCFDHGERRSEGVSLMTLMLHYHATNIICNFPQFFVFCSEISMQNWHLKLIIHFWQSIRPYNITSR